MKDCRRKNYSMRAAEVPAAAFRAIDAYRVDDLLMEKQRVRLVLLLESPYQAEIRHRHPLAGASGVSAIKFLISHVHAVWCLGSYNPSGVPDHRSRRGPHRRDELRQLPAGSWRVPSGRGGIRCRPGGRAEPDPKGPRNDAAKAAFSPAARR